MAQRFLVNTLVEGADAVPITWVLNWTAEPAGKQDFLHRAIVPLRRLSAQPAMTWTDGSPYRHFSDTSPRCGERCGQPCHGQATSGVVGMCTNPPRSPSR